MFNKNWTEFEYAFNHLNIYIDASHAVCDASQKC